MTNLSLELDRLEHTYADWSPNTGDDERDGTLEVMQEDVLASAQSIYDAIDRARHEDGSGFADDCDRLFQLLNNRAMNEARDEYGEMSLIPTVGERAFEILANLQRKAALIEAERRLEEIEKAIDLGNSIVGDPYGPINV